MNDLTADLARANFRADRAEQRIDRLAKDQLTLLLAVARLEGHGDPNIAQRNHLGEQ